MSFHEFSSWSVEIWISGVFSRFLWKNGKTFWHPKAREFLALLFAQRNPLATTHSESHRRQGRGWGHGKVLSFLAVTVDSSAQRWRCKVNKHTSRGFWWSIIYNVLYVYIYIYNDWLYYLYISILCITLYLYIIHVYYISNALYIYIYMGYKPTLILKHGLPKKKYFAAILMRPSMISHWIIDFLALMLPAWWTVCGWFRSPSSSLHWFGGMLGCKEFH